MNWNTSTDTYIWVFNVGRGLSLFIRTPKNYGILYDFGASDVFSPMEFIRSNLLPHIAKYDSKYEVAQAVVSHPHADHIKEIKELKSTSLGLLTCPHDKLTEYGKADERFDFSVVEDHDDLRIYRDLYKDRKLPLQTIHYQDSFTTALQAEYGIYYVRPPSVRAMHDVDQQYGNGCSIVFYFKYGDKSILIPGDMTPQVFEHLLEERDGTEKRYSVFSRTAKPNWHTETSDQPKLSDQLKQWGLSILLAPHHGLKSGFSENLYETIKGGKPDLVVISEKRHLNDGDGEVDSRYHGKDGANGLDVVIDGKLEKQRYSVSTRNGHHWLIKFTSNKRVEVYGETDPVKFLSK